MKFFFVLSKQSIQEKEPALLTASVCADVLTGSGIFSSAGRVWQRETEKTGNGDILFLEEEVLLGNIR